MWRWTPISEAIRFNGHTLVVRIPMRFQRRGGRKRIVARDGREIVPSNKPRADGVLLKPARARRWPKAVEGRRRSLAATAALKAALRRPPKLLLASPWNIAGKPSVDRGMIVTSIGLLVAGLLILFGLCVVVTAAAWLPDLPPPAS